jgi:hypothetical protein
LAFPGRRLVSEIDRRRAMGRRPPGGPAGGPSIAPTLASARGRVSTRTHHKLTTRPSQGGPRTEESACLSHGASRTRTGDLLGAMDALFPTARGRLGQILGQITLPSADSACRFWPSLTKVRQNCHAGGRGFESRRSRWAIVEIVRLCSCVRPYLASIHRFAVESAGRWLRLLYGSRCAALASVPGCEGRSTPAPTICVGSRSAEEGSRGPLAGVCGRGWGAQAAGSARMRVSASMN